MRLQYFILHRRVASVVRVLLCTAVHWVIADNNALPQPFLPVSIITTQLLVRRHQGGRSYDYYYGCTPGGWGVVEVTPVLIVILFSPKGGGGGGGGTTVKPSNLLHLKNLLYTQ